MFLWCSEGPTAPTTALIYLSKRNRVSSGLQRQGPRPHEGSEFHTTPFSQATHLVRQPRRRVAVTSGRRKGLIEFVPVPPPLSLLDPGGLSAGISRVGLGPLTGSGGVGGSTPPQRVCRVHGLRGRGHTRPGRVVPHTNDVPKSNRHQF